MNNIFYKTCVSCNENKSQDMFCKDKSSKDLLYSYCKNCSKLIREKYKENMKEYSKNYRKENIDYIKEKSRIYIQKNKERRKIYLE